MVPVAIPVTNPVLPIVAIAMEPEFHVPPVLPSLSAVVNPVHTVPVPEIGAG